MAERPTGITVLAILAGLGGIVLILLGVFLGVMAGAISNFVREYIKTYGAPAGMGSVDFTAFIESVLVAIAVLAFVFGILNVVVAYGFWVGAGWSRMLAIILLILYIILGLVTLPTGIITIIIAGLLLWYLMQPHVKAWFGAAPQPTPPPAPPAPPT